MLLYERERRASIVGTISRFIRILSASGTLQKNVFSSFRRAMESDPAGVPTARVGALSFFSTHSNVGAGKSPRSAGSAQPDRH
jgi:hypothetical protein